MLDKVESTPAISKAEYNSRLPELRVRLLTAQHELRRRDFPVVLLLAGDDRAAGRVASALQEWMDARYMQTAAFLPPTDEERDRPFFWRFWRNLPGHGRIGTFIQGWTAQSLLNRFTGAIDDSKLEHRLEHVRAFEQMLVNGGAVVLKVWLHWDRGSLKERRKALESGQVNVWTAAGDAKVIAKQYKDNLNVLNRVLRETSTEDAAWHVVSSNSERTAQIHVGELLLAALEARLARTGRPSPILEPLPESRDVLATVDLSGELPKDDYERRLKRWQKRLTRVTRAAYDKQISTVLVFEGWDAAGKGGAIRRLTGAVDAALYRAVPIAAPLASELRYPYLWRFWNRLPRAGHMTIFDRSWYGRLLVERVEGFASEAQWRRAYAEINDFEEQLCEHGVVLLKFWIHIDSDEQLARFKERETIAYKHYKITEEDYRNREKWAHYERAVNDVVALTSRKRAPWHVVAGNDKRSARIEVLKAVCKRLEEAVD